MLTIVCNLNLFTLNQTVYLCDGQGKQEAIINTNISRLAENIVTACYQYDVIHIHLYGANAFANKLATDIKKERLVKYASQDLIIEVN